MTRPGRFLAANVAASRAPRWRAWAALFGVLAVWVALDVAPAWNEPAFDLSALVVGAEVTQEGGFAHLYDHDPAIYNEARSAAFTRAARSLGFDEIPTAFVHTPLVAVAARPLTWLPYPLVARTWLVAAALATLFVLFASARVFAPSLASPSAAAIVLALLLAFEPIRYALALGQTTPFIVALMLGALWSARSERPALAGVLLALPAFIKLTPILLVVPWVVERRWRALSSLAIALAALTCASFVVAGVGPNLEYARRVSEIGRATLVAYNNQSLPALLERLGRPGIEITRWHTIALSPATRTLVGASVAAMIAGGVWAVWGAPPERRERVTCAIAFVVMLLAPTIAWTHYFVLLVPAGALGWELAPAARSPRAVRGVVLAALALCSRPLLLDQVHQLRGPVTILIGPTIAALLVYATVVIVARAGRNRAAHAGTPKPPSTTARTATANTAAAGSTLQSGGTNASAPQPIDGSQTLGSG
jgi:alpha-1,2-mannosyltransferase